MIYRRSRDIHITDQKNLSLEVLPHQEHHSQDQPHLRSILHPVLQDLRLHQDQDTNRVDHKVPDFHLLQHPALFLSKDQQERPPLGQDQVLQNLKNHQEHIWDHLQHIQEVKDNKVNNRDIQVHKHHRKVLLGVIKGHLEDIQVHKDPLQLPLVDTKGHLEDIQVRKAPLQPPLVDIKDHLVDIHLDKVNKATLALKDQHKLHPVDTRGHQQVIHLVNKVTKVRKAHPEDSNPDFRLLKINKAFLVNQELSFQVKDHLHNKDHPVSLEDRKDLKDNFREFRQVKKTTALTKMVTTRQYLVNQV